MQNNIKQNNAEVRQEAVQQALAALKNRPKPSLPMPSKRSSVLNRSPDRDRDDTGNVIVNNKIKKWKKIRKQNKIKPYKVISISSSIRKKKQK